MSDQPKKQELPPLDERYVELTADLDGSEDIDADVRVRLALDCREDQLRTALSDNEALRAQLKSVEGIIAEKLPKPLLRGDGTWYPALMVDARDASIREAVKGDK